LNVINISLNKEIDKFDCIIFALKEYLKELKYRKEEQNRYTKFDSDNDIFLGILGEFAFAKYLSTQNGLNKNKDYFQISRNLNNPECEDAIVNVNGKKYDKYDFKLSFIENQELKIDVKTQKYVGQYTEDWQFAINSQTIEKLKEDPNRIDFFQFIFSQKGIFDFLPKEDIQYLQKQASIEEIDKYINNIESKMLSNEINMELLGMVESKKVEVLSEEFEEGEEFRLNYNKYKDQYTTFKTFSNMHRLDLKYLSNTNKIIPKTVINNPNIDNLKVKEMLKVLPKSKKEFSVYINKEEFKFPYSKIYLNSQFKDFEEMLIHNCSNNLKNQKKVSYNNYK